MTRLPPVIPILLASFGLAALSGCDTVLQQSIVRAHVNYPEPPSLPILPLDPQQRVVLQGGLDRYITSLPLTGVLDDSSGNRLQLQMPSTSYSGNLFFHYKVLFLGLELGDRRSTFMAGTNIQADDWKCLAWAGFGFVDYSPLVTYRQLVSTYDDDTVWRISTDSSKLNSTSLTLSAGVSAMFGTGPVQPFVAARILTGPKVDGTDDGLLASDNSPAASNGFSLTQAMLDGGMRIEPLPWLHAYVGAGGRTYLDKEIPGIDWKVYAGVSFDLLRADPERQEKASPEHRAIPIRPSPSRTIQRLPSDSVNSGSNLDTDPAPASKPAPADIAPRSINYQDVQ
jgi:hypothetical protein